MIFKHDMKFDDSPILRSLERVAIDKGLVTPDPVVKQASVEESYEPTGDLHDDMLKLVAGLRAKGFVREAEDLEHKVNAYKFAKTQKKTEKTLMDLAHPEGDVEVSPSSSGLGKVWTEPGAKEEILRIVNKQPTGKYAAGSDQKKTAQIVADTREINSKIANVWIDLQPYKTQVLPALGATGDYWDFNINDILTDPVHAKSYIEKSNADPGVLERFKTLYSVSFGSNDYDQFGNKSPDDIYHRITKVPGTIDQLNSATNLPYFWGSQRYEGHKMWNKIVLPSDVKPSNDPNSKDNSNSITIWNGNKFVIDPIKARPAAQTVFAMILKAYNEAFSPEFLSTAKKQLDERKNGWVSIVQKTFNRISKDPPKIVAGEDGDITEPAIAISNEIRDIMTGIVHLAKKDSAFVKAYNMLFNSHRSGGEMKWGAFFDVVKNTVARLKTIDGILAPYTGNYNQNMNDVADTFSKAGSILMRYANTFTPDEQENDPEYKAIIRAMNESYAFGDLIRKYIRRGETPEIRGKSGDELIELSKSWLEEVIGVTQYDSPSADDAIYASTQYSIKNAKQRGSASGSGGVTGLLGIKKTPSGQAGSGYKQQGGGASVGAIQQELLKLADLLKKHNADPKVIKTLEMEQYGADNMWGDATKSALEMAEAVRKGYEVKSYPIEPKPIPSTLTNLKAMIDAINDGNWNQASAGPQVKVYDAYPDEHGAKLTSKDVASPMSFYTWLIENNIVDWAPKFYQGQEIILVHEFSTFLKGLIERAKNRYNFQFPDKESKKLAIEYSRSANRIYSKWVELLNNLAKQTGGTVPRHILKSQLATTDRGSSKGRSGSGYEQSGRDGQGGRGDQEGRMLRIPGFDKEVPVSKDVYPPIWDTIDLSSHWWNMDKTWLLDLGRMRSGVRFAKRFANEASEDQRRSAVRDAVQNSMDPRTNVVDKNRVTVEYRNLLMQDGLSTAYGFLTKLLNEISRVENEYDESLTNEKTRRILIPPLGQYAEKWRRKIARMQDQIQREMGRYRRRTRG